MSELDSVQKITGALSLGPVKHEKAAAVYEYMRVGSTHLKNVKIIGQLATLLKNGEDCTLWVVTIRTPTPFLYKTEIHMVFAVECNGVVHQAIEEIQREWTLSKTFTFFTLLGVGFPTIFLAGLGLLFWINALRLVFVKLPIEQMRAAILQAPALIENNSYPKQRGPRMPVKVSDKACPECGAPLLRRDGTGGRFWGCSGWPECRHTEKYS